MKNLSINATNKKNFKKEGSKKNKIKKDTGKEMKVILANNNNPVPRSDKPATSSRKVTRRRTAIGIRLGYLRRKVFTIRRATKPEEQLYLGTGE